MQEEVAEKVIYEGMKTYTSYVSKSRVLPYLDGLKPVFRRVIYAMMRVGARNKMLKSSNILGESIKLHPHGSCLRGDTRVFCLDGNHRTIQEIYESGVSSVEVLSYDIKRRCLVPTLASNFRIGQYTDTVYSTKFKDGRGLLETTGNHPLLSRDGNWIKSEDLTCCDILFNWTYGLSSNGRPIINNQEVYSYTPTIQNRLSRTLLEISPSNIKELLNIYYSKRCLIEDIDTIEVEKEPMYDFTVNGMENMLVFTSENNLVCVHNSSVYGALQTLVCSPNSLITGKGNWGNGIYSPYMAAERYTEARLSPIFEELIDPYFENLGEFVPTYDESSIEPRIIEFRLPLAELIGVYGIGVALTTDCPALHIDTVIDKVLSQLDHREVKSKFAYGSWLYKDKIIPQFEIEDDGKKSWLTITSVPNSKYLDPITENTFIRELCASGQLIIDDQSQKTKGIIKFRVSGPSDTLQTIINKLSFRPIEDLVYYDNRIRHSGYYESWVAHRLQYIQRIFYYKQIKEINKKTIQLALSKIHSRLETEFVKGREGFLSLVGEVGESVFQDYENFLTPYYQYCENWKLEKSDFLSSLKSTSISSLKSYDIPDFQWHTFTMSECKDYLIEDISKINRKLFSSPTRIVKEIPKLPEEVKITRYVTLRGNQVEVRFKRIPRMTNWTTDTKIIVIYEDGSQRELPNSFFGLYDDPNKKVVGFTFPNTVTVFVTDTKIHAYVRFSKVTEIIKSAFPCKKIKINGTDYKVSGGKSWTLGQWSVVEP